MAGDHCGGTRGRESLWETSWLTWQGPRVPSRSEILYSGSSCRRPGPPGSSKLWQYRCTLGLRSARWTWQCLLDICLGEASLATWWKVLCKDLSPTKRLCKLLWWQLWLSEAYALRSRLLTTLASLAARRIDWRSCCILQWLYTDRVDLRIAARSVFNHSIAIGFFYPRKREQACCSLANEFLQDVAFI